MFLKRKRHNGNCSSNIIRLEDVQKCLVNILLSNYIYQISSFDDGFVMCSNKTMQVYVMQNGGRTKENSPTRPAPPPPPNQESNASSNPQNPAWYYKVFSKRKTTPVTPPCLNNSNPRCKIVIKRKSSQSKISTLEPQPSTSQPLPFSSVESLLTEKPAPLLENISNIFDNQAKPQKNTTFSFNTADSHKLVGPSKSAILIIPHSEPTQTCKPSDSFIKKILKKKTSKSAGTSHTTYDESFVGQQNLDSFDENCGLLCTTLDKTDNLKNSCSLVPLTTYIGCNHDELDFSHREALAQVKEFVNQVQESESAVKAVIQKYFKDDSLGNTLLTKLDSYSKSQIDAERRAFHLSNDLYSKQIEILNFQRDSLHQTIKYLISQNRHMQEENDLLDKRNEKLVYRLHVIEQQNTNQDNTLFPSSFISNSESILRKNNEKLRVRHQSNISQIINLEQELVKIQTRNAELLAEIRQLKGEIQNQKNLLTRSIDDQRLEVSFLSNDLSTKVKIITESQESCQILLQDLQVLQQALLQNRCVPNLLNVNESATADRPAFVINLSRTWINILAHQLFASKQSEVAKEHDLETLRSETGSLKTELAETKSKLIQSPPHNCKACLREKALNDSLDQVKKRLNDLREEYNTFKNQSKSEQETYVERIKQYEVENKELRDQLSLTSQMSLERQQISDTERENLQAANKSLEKALESSGIKEMTDNLATYQAQCYKYQSENEKLREQITGYTQERDTIVEYQNKYYEHLLRLHNEMISLKTQLADAQTKLTHVKEERIALEYENKHLQKAQESNKSLEEQLRADSNQIRELETEVSNLRNEIHKVNLTYGHTKHLLDRHIEMLQMKEVHINELDVRINQLMEQHSNDTNEKAVLCGEVSCLMEQQKRLCDSIGNAQQLVKSTELMALSKFSMLEETKQNDRKSLQVLADEYQKLSEHKERIEMAYQKISDQVEELQAVIQKQNSENRCLRNQLLDMHKKLQSAQDDLQKALQRIQSEEAKLNEEKVKKLCADRTTLENTVKCLECSLKTQHDDLNQARKMFRDAQNKLDAENQRVKELERNCNGLQEDNRKFVNEIENLKRQLNIDEEKLEEANRQLNITEDEYIKLQNEFEKHKSQSNNQNESLSAKLNSTERDLALALSKLQCVNNEKEIIEKKMSQVLKEYEMCCNKCSCKEKEKVISELKDDLEKAQNQIETLTCQVNKANCDYGELLRKRENDFKSFKALSDEIFIELNDCKALIQEDLAFLRNHEVECRENYNTSHATIATIQKDYRKLIENLLRAISMLINERLTHQELQCHYNEIKCQHEICLRQLEQLDEESYALRTHIEELEVEKNKLNQFIDQTNPVTVEDESQQTEKIENNGNDRGNNSNLKKNQGKCKKFSCRSSKLSPNPAESVEKKLEELQKKLEQKHKIILQLQNQVIDMEKELAVLRFENTEMKIEKNIS